MGSSSLRKKQAAMTYAPAYMKKMLFRPVLSATLPATNTATAYPAAPVALMAEKCSLLSSTKASDKPWIGP